MNELTEFEQQNLILMSRICESEHLIKEIQSAQKQYKANLIAAMEKYNVKSLDNGFLKVTYVPESQSTSVDLKTFKEKEPDEYEGLLEDYPKVTKRSAYVRIKVKD